MQLHTIKGYIQNIFLVEYPHGLLLLDGCGRADVDKVCGFIEKDINRSLNDLKCIVVTHMHPDHAGGAHRLRTLTGCKLYSHPYAASWYAGLAGRLSHFIDIILALWVAGRLGRPKKQLWYPAILKPDSLLANEQVIPEFPEWQVLYTPGHTNHDLSLYHKPSHQVYVADLIVRVKGRNAPPYPVCHPNQYRLSLRRIAALDTPKVLFAHSFAQSLSPEDIDEVTRLAPSRPKNHWHSSKARIYRALRLPPGK
jgi:glyoxylase-like metal-dependent hydrolase (beta-lactamase superfamily II)